MMKKMLMIFAATVAALAAKADDTSERLIKSLNKKISAYEAYEARFTASAEGFMAPAKGVYMVYGDSFYISVDPVEAYSDGRVKYEINEDNMEVVIDNVDPADKNILSNPARAFDFLDGTFTHSYAGTERFDGILSDIVTLVPKKKIGLSRVDLVFNAKSGDLMALRYTVDGSSSMAVVVRLDFIGAVAPSEIKRYAYDKSKYADYEIIDFR